MHAAMDAITWNQVRTAVLSRSLFSDSIRRLVRSGSEICVREAMIKLLLRTKNLELIYNMDKFRTGTFEDYVARARQAFDISSCPDLQFSPQDEGRIYVELRREQKKGGRDIGD